MNDLQLTLLIVGGGGIAAMIAYNWWQDYRLREQAKERFGESDQDPLLNVTKISSMQQRSEPGLMSDPFVTTGSNAPIGIQEIYDEGVADQNLQNDPQHAIDKRIFADFFVQFEDDKDANTWKTFMDGLDQINRKRIVYSVSPDVVNGDSESFWFKASPYAGTARTLKVSVQIANRKGPLSSIEFSQVLSKLKRFADEHTAELEFPDMKEVLARAETLDQAAAALDTLLGLHCLLADTVQEATVVDMLNKAGWVQNGHQWFLPDDTGVLANLVIHNAPGKRLLSFNIDVPNSPEPVKALGDIVTVCHGMNQQFGAPLMDDSGRTLSTQSIEGIFNQLSERVRNLSDSGFKPGAPVARILFS